MKSHPKVWPLPNPAVQAEIFMLQTEVLQAFPIEKDNDYIVRITAKIPSNGQIQVNMGSWEYFQDHAVNVVASNDFQDIEVSIPDYPEDIKNAHILFQNGFIKGTTIIRSVEVIDKTNDEKLIAERDFTSPYWFGDEGTGATYEMTSDGVAITNPAVQAEMWSPQTSVLDATGVTIKRNHSYKVIITAKIPSNGQLQVNMGGGEYSEQYAVDVAASSDFQDIEVLFQDFNENLEDVYVLFQNGKIKGTSIVQNVRIVDLGDIPVPLKYNYISGKYAEVIKDPDRKYKGAVVIPATVSHNGTEYTVTKIADDAFADCTSLTSITIPATVTSLSGSSFGNCTELTEIIVDPANTVYDSRNNCNAIIEKATNTLVVGCQTTVIPNSVTKIGSWAFWGRWDLENIAIPSSVKTIGDAAFAYCVAMWEINLPSSVETIEGWAFQNCALKSITLPASLTTLGNEAFRECKHLESVVIPDGLEEIPDSCFKYCEALTSINLNKVKIIGGGAFGSTGLTNLVLPATVKEVKDEAFSCCPLQSLDLGKVEKVGDASFISTGIEELTIPATLTEVGIEAFSWNFSMKKATFQDGCTKVFDTMFHGNENLCEVILPNTITEIQDRAFRACKNLATLLWPEKLERIGEQAFQESGITSAVLPASMKWIDNDAFNNCKQLVDVDIVYIEHLGHGAFSECPKIKLISLPSTIVIDENSWGAFAWDTGLETVEFFEGTTVIDNLTFIGCENLKNLPYGLPQSLERIGEQAFGQCKSLESITLPKNITWIQENAFNNCESLTSVYSQISDPSKVEFENDVFAGISKTAVLYIPKGTTNAYKEKGWTKYFASVVEIEDDDTIPISGVGQTTWCSAYDLDFTTVEGLKAYIASGYDRETGVIWLTRVKKVPAGEGILLIGEKGDYTVPHVNTTAYYANLMVGTLKAIVLNETEGEYTNYYLSNGASGVGFYKVNGSVDLKANRAYLPLLKGTTKADTRFIGIGFDDEDGTTGISNISINEKDVWYNLQGQRVENPGKGIYIRNGKKVIVK